MELSFHATGAYPDWWEGKRFPRPIRAWFASNSNEATRDNPQRVLLGSSTEWGTGSIPRSAIVKTPTMARGFPDLVDTVQIQHVSGGISVLQAKAYEQGRRKWQGATLDLIWLDEEPDAEIYSEALARTTASGGIIMLTMTPLLGMTEVVNLFHPKPTSETRSFVHMTIDDSTHFGDEEERALIVDSYPAHERDARARGYPMLGSGKVFSVPQSAWEEEPFELPEHWPRIAGVDFGYGDHPFAAAELAWDRDADIYYVTKAYKEKEPIVAMHASAVRPWGEWLPFAWPHDGHRDWGDSGPIADQYRREGLRMLREHATFKQGGYSPEAGVQIILGRMQTGRFKVFAHLGSVFEEFATYHRKDGKLVAVRDDLISAIRQAIMMVRFARTPWGGKSRTPTKVIDSWDVFGGDYA